VSNKKRRRSPQLFERGERRVSLTRSVSGATEFERSAARRAALDASGRREDYLVCPSLTPAHLTSWDAGGGEERTHAAHTGSQVKTRGAPTPAGRHTEKNMFWRARQFLGFRERKLSFLIFIYLLMKYFV